MHSRALNLFLAFFCHELLIAAYYFQYVKGLEPCPLCILQRIALLGLAIIFLFLGLTNAKKGGVLNRGFNGLGAISALAGVVFAGRQVWLQHLPAEEVPACGPGFDYMMDVFNGTELLSELFKGSGECAKVDWTLFGFSMAECTLAMFTTLFLFCVWRAWKN